MWRVRALNIFSPEKGPTFYVKYPNALRLNIDRIYAQESGLESQKSLECRAIDGSISFKSGFIIIRERPLIFVSPGQLCICVKLDYIVQEQTQEPVVLWIRSNIHLSCYVLLYTSASLPISPSVCVNTDEFYE
jgi:hypothetical protein